MIQEGEELESSGEHFVFKGTAYRPDGSQTTFVWTVSLNGDDSYISKSMALGQGDWHENPVSTFERGSGQEDAGQSPGGAPSA